jgi:hypothetical protein
MCAVGEEALEPRFGFGHCVGLGDAGDIEAAQLRLLAQRSFDLGRIGQKSRSA